MAYPKGLIQHLNSLIHEDYKKGMSIEDLAEAYDLPELVIRKAIHKNQIRLDMEDE